MRLLRELGRRKLRTALTIGGITIGIWALVVFSSMANKIDALVDGGSQYYADKIIVTDASNMAIGFGMAPMRADVADQLQGVPGVKGAVPEIQLMYSTDGGGMGVAETILGVPPGAFDDYEEFELTLLQGRFVEPSDEGSRVVALGADLARKEGVTVGDTLSIRDEPFEVIGVLEPTLTAPDATAFVPYEAARELFIDTLPAPVRAVMSADELVSQVVVHLADDADPDAVATAIEAEVDSVSTLTGADFDEQVGSVTAIFNAIILGVAGISLVVGGLSVINTMAMSVAERTREIGIKRAIGGARGRIIRELVLEAGAIGLLGGLIGLALGAAVVLVANEAGRASGTVLFELTGGTALFAVAFSTLLGMLAGIVPAWSAARLDPVSALRYE